MGFFDALGRPFDPVTDWSYFGPAVGLLSDSVGRPAAIGSLRSLRSSRASPSSS